MFFNQFFYKDVDIIDWFFLLFYQHAVFAFYFCESVLCAFKAFDVGLEHFWIWKPILYGWKYLDI